MIKPASNSVKFDVEVFLKVLAYFDIFKHPLTQPEIINLSDKVYSPESQKEIFQQLLKNKQCFEYKGYYSLQQNVSKLVNDRILKEKEGLKYIKRLPFFCQFN